MAESGKGGGGRGGDLLIEAIEAGDIVEYRRLLKSKEEGDDEEKDTQDRVIDIHEKGHLGRSPIILASILGHVNIAELLLSKGANIHDKDNDDTSPIIWASIHGYVEMFELLLSKGANIHDEDDLGNSAIQYASMYGHVDIAELLLSNGAKINDTNTNGYSLIMFASLEGCVDVVELLLSKGASIHLLPAHFASCFSIARYKRHIRVLYRLRKWPTTMGIIMLQELGLEGSMDNGSILDLHQYLGRPDDCSKSDNEEDYKKDREGNVL